ncbi:hypothetical protein M409DRAFT_24833 [Zasmidium cellare ATCC 36951]|uniref:DUF4185 domain-containing protein n=1 Tax=Zasmidium cellare ATCC 36951 TaxID=1080233 RepID=A0A6A6CD12_ZASCE|nr:uncharacterized protein M409DRAFT_24833 [Zasmidium cellare ATCC 36951]KAF2164931.1 hypothetical protein M409DRAFT_24833 [Zasmidium cellare ATCC 36951]
MNGSARAQKLQKLHKLLAADSLTFALMLGFRGEAVAIKWKMSAAQFLVSYQSGTPEKNMAIIACFLPITSLLVTLGHAQSANPIKVNTESTQFLGAETSSNDPNLFRDGGSQGVLNNVYYQIYADTCQKNNPNDTDCATFRANSIGVSTYSPTVVQDFSNPPAQFCTPSNGARIHLTNLVPTDGAGGTHGAMWYMALASCSQNINGCTSALGVALVQTAASGQQPTCSVLYGFWDTTKEPMWGSIGAVGPQSDGYIYVFGTLDASQNPQATSSDMYVARVLPGNVGSLNSYQYWNGASFQSQRITSGYSTASVLKDVSPGSVRYNSYYKSYIAINLVNGNTLQAYTASVPQGSWSGATTLWSNSSYGSPSPLYDPQGLSFRDTSGKTLAAQMSQFPYNTIKVTIKLFFQ